MLLFFMQPLLLKLKLALPHELLVLVTMGVKMVGERNGGDGRRDVGANQIEIVYIWTPTRRVISLSTTR